MTRDEWMNWNPGQDSVLAEQAGISQAMRRHDAREREKESNRRIWKGFASIVALFIAGLLLWAVSK